MCSAKKLLTSSERQFLLLPRCVSAHLACCFKGAPQALAMPTAQRTEKGTRHSMLQIVNPQVCMYPAYNSSQLDSAQEDVIFRESIGPFLISERTVPDPKEHRHLRFPIPTLGRTSSRDLHATYLSQYLFL